jgi:hypothetical protein
MYTASAHRLEWGVGGGAPIHTKATYYTFLNTKT